MASWIQALSRTRNRLSDSLGNVFRRGRDLDEITLEELEETLLGADVPVRLVGELIQELESGARGDGASRQSRLRQKLIDTLSQGPAFDWGAHDGLLSLLIVGVNGSGKTTTAAKLAHHAQVAGCDPLLGAADTFRAAGSDQLRIWADRLGCDVVSGATGADAAAVAYDAIQAATARSKNVLIVDTAGRMHTKAPLMQELKKVSRSMAKCDATAPRQTWIVLDATIGQNALIQAREFHQSVPLSGVIVSKLDGSAKAGFLFGVSRELGVPILFAGLGEQADDLVPFDAASFVDALLGVEATVESV